LQRILDRVIDVRVVDDATAAVAEDLATSNGGGRLPP